jgi:hypothetical protein
MKAKLKCSIAVLAAAFAAMTTNVSAENIAPMNTKPLVSKAVQLTDAELDAITAGSAMSFVVVFNRGGKTGEVGNMEHHLTTFVPTEGKTFTLHVVANRAHPNPVTICHGHCP